jgi:amino-acid N-acetyltransferase
VTPSALPVLKHVHRAPLATGQQRRPPLTIVRDADGAPSLRSAAAADAACIHALLERFVGVGLLLPRSEAQVLDAIADFIVAVEGDRVVGSVALRSYSPQLAEIGALAVADELQGTGLGCRLVEAAVQEARSRGVRCVFALTMQVGFFHRLGFATAELAQFPQKLAADCASCARRTVCTEVAVALAL